MVNFVAELPPRKRAGRAPDPLLLEFATELRERPGVWAEWPKESAPSTLSSLVSHIRQGRFASLPPSDFQAAMRDGVVYVRCTVDE